MANEFKHASVGGELTQAEWEALATHIADGQTTGDMLYFNGTYWKRIPYCIGARVYHDAAQEIANNTATILAFNAERYDTDVIHDVSTNNSRLTCKTAGKYLITLSVSWEVDTNGGRSIQIKLNGTTSIADQAGPPQPDGYSNQTISTIYDLAVNEYVEARVYQSSGSAIDISSSGNSSPEFSMQRIG